MTKIMDILIIITLVICNLMIGSPLRYNIDIPCLIISIVAIIYFIFSIKEKKKIELNRFDLFVIALTFSTLIPLIANSYIRFRYTLEYILRYVSAFNVYLIIKQYLKKDRNKMNIIINIITIMSIITIFFGIDMMTSNTLDGFYNNIIKAPNVTNQSKERMLSLFKYPNSFCTYLGIALFVSIGAYLSSKEEKNSDKIKKVLYTNAIFMQLFGIVMTFSRLGWIIIFGLLIFYAVCIKDKWKDILKVLGFSGANAFIYFCFFNKALNNGKYFAIWSLLIVQNIVQFVVLLKQNYFIKMVKKINLKFIWGIFILGCITIIICYLKAPNELVLFNSSTSQKQYRKTNIVVEGNKEYRFKINLTTKSNKKDNFGIYINEFNEREEKINENKNIFYELIDGEIELVVKTKSDTKFLSIMFLCAKPDENSKMIVHSVYMNDKEIKVYYKLLPISFVTRLEKIRFDSASVDIRFSYIQQAINIIKENPLFGLGGYAWRDFFITDVNLQSVAEHCYPLQLFMQNGILSIWIYLYLIFLIVYKMIKTIKNKEKDIIKISFFMSLFLLILHSLFDFDMYFQIMLIEMYIGFAIINLDEAQEAKCRKLLYCIYAIILVFLLYFSIGEIFAMRFDIEKIDESKRMNVVNSHLILFPYDWQYYKDKAVLLFNMQDNDITLDGLDINDEINKCVEFLEKIEKIEKIKLSE